MDVPKRSERDKKRSPQPKFSLASLERAKYIMDRTERSSALLKGWDKGKTDPLEEVSVVWMQGTVLEVKSDHNTTVLLLDETGTFMVNGISNIPKGRPCLFPGKYVMVMGIIQSCTPEPVLRAVKMADLSGNPVHRNMWKFEVEDLQQILE